MNQNDKTRFLQVLTVMTELFDKELNETGIDMYFHVLGDLSIEEFEDAVAHLLRTKTFNKFPLPGEFVQRLKPEIDPESQAILAMDKVFDMMEGAGAYSTVQFDDPAIHYVIDHWGGWIAFCNSRLECTTEDRDQWWQRQFIRLYKTYRYHRPDGDPPRLVGFIERTNVRLGYENYCEQPISRIGDSTEKPKQIESAAHKENRAEHKHSEPSHIKDALDAIVPKKV